MKLFTVKTVFLTLPWEWVLVKCIWHKQKKLKGVSG